ncbi:MAG: class I SAM-dependent methyltransferase, partial [Chryseobacterium sp.]|nr:class I SAM-dependent methyltransferase [Chryseobacterium sp.]
MSELKRVAKTLVGYIKRPDLYPELGRKIIKNIFNRKSAFRGKARTTEWAQSLAVNQETAIGQLFGIKFENFQNLFSEELHDASKRE